MIITAVRALLRHERVLVCVRVGRGLFRRVQVPRLVDHLLAGVGVAVVGTVVAGPPPNGR